MTIFALYWLILVFIFGAAVGSFVNVAATRLPLEKSLVWPGSRCGSCLQPIRWYDNLPLISYLRLRGKCRTCGATFSCQYVLVELVTGVGFAGLFYLEVIRNIHHWPEFTGSWAVQHGVYPWQWWVAFAWHAVLFSFLLTASVCDLDGREIPIQLTLSGAVVGLSGSIFLAWPWPFIPDLAPIGATPRFTGFGVEWMDPGAGLKAGLYPWPVWGPLPAWLAPGGNWQTGLITALAGGLAGTFLLRAVRFLCTVGLGREALGLGDADLMMMAGCFLGWQPVVVAFFVAPLPGLMFGAFNLIVRKDDSLPFGPSLAVGVMITVLCWGWLGEYVQPMFFWGSLMLVLVAVCAVLLLGLSYVMRLARK